MQIDLNSHDQLWLPGLAERLVLSLKVTAPRPDDVQQRDVDESTQERSDLSRRAPASWQLGRSVVAIEYPSSEVAARSSGLSFAMIDPERSSDQLQEAADVLGTVDGLVDTLGLLVRTVHLLKAPIGYDVSHSDPGLPFSIFVSLPQPGETDGVSRLAEAILHESMHLQLTMIELQVQLIADGLKRMYSPWKHEVRPISGVLHGLYVFAVIHQVCERWAASQRRGSRYGHRRRAEIEKEVATLPECPPGLSPIGSELWRKCRHSILTSSQWKSDLSTPKS
jgi:HEXXH motif-containing protein